MRVPYIPPDGTLVQKGEATVVTTYTKQRTHGKHVLYTNLQQVHKNYKRREKCERAQRCGGTPYCRNARRFHCKTDQVRHGISRGAMHHFLRNLRHHVTFLRHGEAWSCDIESSCLFTKCDHQSQPQPTGTKLSNWVHTGCVVLCPCTSPWGSHRLLRLRAP